MVKRSLQASATGIQQAKRAFALKGLILRQNFLNSVDPIDRLRSL